MEVQLNGIIRYQSLLAASAAKKANGQEYAQKHYSIDLILSKQDPNIPLIINGLNAAIVKKFPTGVLPLKANLAFNDLAITEPGNAALANYYQLRITQKVENGRPECNNMMNQPIVDPSQIKCGDRVWVKGMLWAYDTGDGGTGCFLNGTLITGEAGEIPVEALSSKPSSAQMFANVPGFVDQSSVPVASVPVAGVPVAGVPVAGVPVAGVPVAGVPVAGQF